MTELEKRFNSATAEKKWYSKWMEEGHFEGNTTSSGEPFSIVIPPPNVTGALHMGHALNGTLQDVLVRMKRMQGFNTCWVPGIDHAGIATQHVVEKKLHAEGKSREGLGREAFLKEVWAWKEQYGDRILRQERALGISCDWERTRFTMDEGLSVAVREAFVRLYRDDLIYRGYYMVNWCPHDTTALADDEVESVDENGSLWSIKYPIVGETGHVVVATTRPETMLGDTAVAVHPDDERYKRLIGKKVKLPLTNREIPIIADEYVDREFGTGCLKITPAHDTNDYELGKRHDLEIIVVIDEKGNMNDLAGPFTGMNREDARTAVIEALQIQKCLLEVAEHTHAVPHCYRCNTVLEPRLSKQWFVKMRPLAEGAIEATKNDTVSFHPSRWSKVYLSWLENVRDWCISRQLWWGHQIPAWHCADCEGISVGIEDSTECSECGSTNIEQDPDVLDTWFSSALWPFSTFGWPEKTADLDKYYPTSVLFTGRDIIYFWVARMVMTGLKFTGKHPFDDVYIHANILDKHGAVMSKSKGNGIDPIEMIDKYGADATRFLLVWLTTEGQDLKLDPERFKMGTSYATKIWNVSRFCLMNLEGKEVLANEPIKEIDLEFEDKWILSRLNTTINAYTTALEEYSFSDAIQQLYAFLWGDFCDWYVEIVKFRFREDADTDSAIAGRRVLAYVMDRLLRLLHPVMPFLSEEVWAHLNEVVPSRWIYEGENTKLENRLIVAKWPEYKEERSSQETESSMNAMQSVIRSVRNVRQKMNIKPRDELDITIVAPDEKTARRLNECTVLLQRLAVISEPQIGVNLEKPEDCATEVFNGIQIHIPLSGLIDVEAELERTQKALAKKQDELGKVESKLGNESFVSRAPEEVVERERERRDTLKADITALDEHIKGLKK